MYSHTGTHIDAPAHIIKEAHTLDLLPIDNYYGKALLLNLTKIQETTIGIKELKPHQALIAQVDFVLLYTGWSRHWGTPKYFCDYHALTPEAANWLNQFKLKGLGLDTISADKADSHDYPIHNALLKQGLLIIENLTNLDKLPCNQFMFSCFPLNFEKADGSPVRAVAFIEPEGL